MRGGEAVKSWFDSSTAARTVGGQSAGFSLIADEIRLSFADCPEVEAFFEELQLLKGIPVSQLLIDDGLLPEEALRFFYIDENWVDCLIDGAMSIGRDCERDAEYDRLLFYHVAGRSREQSRGRRNRIYRMKPPKQDENSEVRTGFLLRSRLVAGWPGLEVVCYGEKKALLTLRLERICPDVLLCIAEGIIDEIEFTEPGEGAFFGFYRESGEICQSLVSLAPGEFGKNLHQFLPVPFREGGDGVVDILALVDHTEEELEKQGKSGTYFSSLEFAAEMLHERTKVSIQLDWNREGRKTI